MRLIFAVQSGWETIGTLNVRSVGKKYAAVCDLLNTHSLNILALQETCHENTDYISLRRAAPPGYAVTEGARRSTTSKRPSDRVQNYGGASIVYRSSFKSSKLSSQPQVITLEYICCRLHGDTSGDVVASVYRPGSAVVTPIFIAKLTTFLEALATYRCPVVLLGDFNVHL